MSNFKKVYTVDNYHENTPAHFLIQDKCICISSVIKANSIWEPHLHKIFEKCVNSNSIVIECGCHIGTHTVKLAKICHTIYGFEPMPETNNILHINLGLNKIKNAIISSEGLSYEIGKTSFIWINKTNPGGSCLDNNPMGNPPNITDINQRIKVSLTTIDTLNLEKVDFIKIDVEGYEPYVIRGAMKTIEKCKPIIVMEVWKNYNCDIDMNYTKQLFQCLLDIGYTVEYIDGPDFLFLPNNT